MSNAQLDLNTHVFIAKYPFDADSGKLIAERQTEIDGCRDEQVKQSKFYAFKLLEYAINKVYGLSIDECNLTKSVSGKWTSDKFHLSITHCEDIVAVAVSNTPVGIDTQIIDLSRFDCKLRRKILTACEFEQTKQMTEEQSASYANLLWTVKESVFKRGCGKTFIPCQIDVTNEKFESVTVADGNKKYYLTVSTADKSAVEYHAINVEYAALRS